MTRLPYVPRPKPNDWSDNPLADLWAANRELQIDEVAELMEDLGLSSAHRELVQRYYDGELEHKNRRSFLGGVLRDGKLSEENLIRIPSHDVGMSSTTIEVDSVIPSGAKRSRKIFPNRAEPPDLERFFGRQSAPSE